MQVTSATWQAAMRIVAGVGDLMQRTGDGRIGRVLDSQTIERSGDSMCGLHHARVEEEHEFLGLASKPRAMVCQWFFLKPTGTVSLGLASKKVVTGFPVWASKPAAPVW
jgi:hypothetical protein